MPGFRIHYPLEYEAWARRAAGLLQAARERTAAAAGHAPADVVDVLVLDPEAQPNGMALPFLGWPRMVLWTTSPAADSVVGHYRDWAELLIVHEDAHLVHLLRPSRSPARRLLERTLLPIGPVAFRSPRWAAEGYATLLEGALTGAGRPHSDLRASILRRWAQRGQLPPYARLSRDPERWQGHAMAYLAGSAFLEWLQRRGGPDSLRHLWARMTARTGRSFDAAFAGVFGDSPASLYGRFVAELTAGALAIEEALAPYAADGDLWQRMEWSTGAPAVSPDGTRLAVVVRHRDRPARLVVFDTGPDAQADAEWRRRLERRLAADPDDVPPVRVGPLPRRPVHELQAADGVEPHWPAWMPDGRSLLFVRFEPDADGVRRPDLFRWHPESGRVDRLTRRAGLRTPDAASDGGWAVAVRQRHGFSQLVRVDLAGGLVSPITEPSLEVVYDRPRISPDGRQLAYLRNDGGPWRLVVRDLEDGREREIPTLEGATVLHAAWHPGGRALYAALGRDGFIDLHLVDAAGLRAPRRMTRTSGAALAPAPSADGRVYFLGLEPHGLDLRVIPADAAAGAGPPFDARLWPAVAPAPRPVPPLRETPVAPGRPYAEGPQEFMPLVGGLHAPAARALEVGVRGGDLVGRLSYLAVASLAADDRGPAGAAAAGAWRGWPIELYAHAFSADERLSAQPRAAPGLGRVLDARRRGVEAGARWQRLGRGLRIDAGAGALFGSIEPAAGSRAARRLAFARAGYQARPGRGRWHLRHGVALGADRGRTGADPWHRVGWQADLGAGRDRASLAAAWEHRDVSGNPTAFDRIQVGGLRGSLLPDAALGGRVHVPALPAGTLVGDRYERQRLELRLRALPLFYERHRVWNAGEPRGAWLALAGADVRIRTGPLPIARLPAADVRVGVARVLDPPFEGETRWWVGLAWTP